MQRNEEHGNIRSYAIEKFDTSLTREEEKLPTGKEKCNFIGE